MRSHIHAWNMAWGWLVEERFHLAMSMVGWFVEVPTLVGICIINTRLFLLFRTSHLRFLTLIWYHLLLSRSIHELYQMKLASIVLATEYRLTLLNFIMKPIYSACVVHTFSLINWVDRSLDYGTSSYPFSHVFSTDEIIMELMIPNDASWNDHHHVPPYQIPLRVISVMCIYPILSNILRVMFLSTKSIPRIISRISKRQYLLISLLNWVLSKIYTLVHISLHLRLRLIKPYFKSFVMSLSGFMKKFQVSTQI